MQVSVVTYHYVRDVRGSRFPGIKALGIREFEEQIRYVKRHYTVMGGDDLLAWVDTGFPENRSRAALLTFDDGYLEHARVVLPILKREGLTACFFPPAVSVVEGRVLDVNKVQFVLAACPSVAALVAEIFRFIDEHGPRVGAESKEAYWNRLAVEGRFDPKEIVFVKRCLQRELPESMRRHLIDCLFSKYITSDERSFGRELYMSVDDIAALRREGMYVGSHGYDHVWLNYLDREEQEREIDRSVEFLERLGIATDRWIMCYPYGAYNNSLLDILGCRGAKLGLTTKPGIADLRRDCLLALPRLDTNDLPKDADAAPNHWTLRAG